MKPEITTPDAMVELVKYLQNPPVGHAAQMKETNYGYDLYVPTCMRRWYRDACREDLEHKATEEKQRLAPAFLNAAWELCRRGVLRPGVVTVSVQSTPDGSAGLGFSVTPFGRQWLDEVDADSDPELFVPTEPERFGELLAQFRSRFGEGFQQRAQEAIKCFNAHAYLACCAMCGAAAEAVILSAAIAKKGNDEEVLKLYRTVQGRSKLEKLLLSTVKEHVRRAISARLDVLKYWRDASAHGEAQDIDATEAHTALLELFGLATHVDKNWELLTET